MMPGLQLWTRIGDGSNYESHGDDLDAMLDLLTEAGTGKVIGWRSCGLITENYDGNNYISLYWGDADAEREKDLNAKEKRKVERHLGHV